MIEDTWYYRKLDHFLREGRLSRHDRNLVVCGGKLDEKVLEGLGFQDYMITSLYDEETCDIKNYKKEDAQCLSFADASYDNVIVHAGLHHCHSPHQALCEMYRVASNNVIVFEAQDSLLMRFLVKLGLALEYEFDAVIANGGKCGGVDNLPIPNYIYRWTRREVEKLVRSLDPSREPDIQFDYEFYFHPCHLDGYVGKHMLTKILGKRATHILARVCVALLNLLLKHQGNQFVVLIRKAGRLHQWIRETGEGYEFYLHDAQ